MISKGNEKIMMTEQRVFWWYSDVLPFKKDRKIKLNE